ncbi:24645_t:CDS:2 [Cetraspora pellucida]|uniref:24645_t:CDS:1 n=1 Tax=Cetraspora pellucida TaxID=1433469 RepID=A0A9N9ARQ3_9GLOM|nr:24645_t:CDS:2 [Cetraspora pellucida]
MSKNTLVIRAMGRTLGKNALVIHTILARGVPGSTISDSLLRQGGLYLYLRTSVHGGEILLIVVVKSSNETQASKNNNKVVDKWLEITPQLMNIITKYPITLQFIVNGNESVEEAKVTRKRKRRKSEKESIEENDCDLIR